jgi:pimeloyl-ACP methyl ester carboxylesterase
MARDGSGARARTSSDVTAIRRRIPELTLIEHEFAVPLDHASPAGETLTIFAREVIGDVPGAGEFPLLVFFQGGPGHEAPRTTAAPAPQSWLERALQEFRVLMLDQRGTGRSTPAGALAGMSPERQADYLTHFRADSIVRDAEWIRRELGVERWSVLGQSFGGFCVLTYLSFFPDALREAFLAGGLPPIARPTDDVYERTYPRVIDRCRSYYDRYPDDRERVLEIHRRIEEGSIHLPSGDRLTARRFQQLGLMLGMGDGAERLHGIVELAPDSPAFLYDVDAGVGFSRNPLYAAVHESCYADGCVTGWSAERLRPRELDDPAMFTGEHVYPWMFEDYSALRHLREAAELLAHHQWPRLYDEAQLAANNVLAAAVIYTNDMYVDRALSEETASRVRNLRPWLTSEYEHDGLRVDGARILDRLIALARG